GRSPTCPPAWPTWSPSAARSSPTRTWWSASATAGPSPRPTPAASMVAPRRAISTIRRTRRLRSRPDPTACRAPGAMMRPHAAPPRYEAIGGHPMIELVIRQRRRDLGAFEVGRVLPHGSRRMVGPYVFFDRMGPKDLAPGLPPEADVRPHPHIGLSTITYLFDGEIMHRDSVGSGQGIRPGEVNWMTAGRGITHSERFERLRREGGPLDGIQAWVALPDGREEMDPGFWHYPAAALPVFDGDGIAGRLIAG